MNLVTVGAVPIIQPPTLERSDNYVFFKSKGRNNGSNRYFEYFFLDNTYNCALVHGRTNLRVLALDSQHNNE